MKKRFNKLFLVGMILILSLNACEKDDDANDPDIDPRDKFTGAWLCTEDDKKIAYTVNIILDPSNSSQILLKNFNLFGEDKSAYGIVTNNLVTVPSQPILNNDVYGKGNYINAKTINWEYYVNDVADIDTITAVYTK